MVKKLTLSVAGAGKTSNIIDSIEKDSRVLVVTYTRNNYAEIRKRIIRKLGEVPGGVKVYTYFEFLYSFCYKPLYANAVKAKGIDWNATLPRGVRQSSPRFFLTSGDRFYSARLSKFLLINREFELLVERIEKYFDLFCFDEVQDLAGNDFNFICALAKWGVGINLVGDFFQHTFDTSRDGNVNASLHDDLPRYINRFASLGLDIDTETLAGSYRCSPTVCNFINDKLGIDMKSRKEGSTFIEVVDEDEQILALARDPSIVKLFLKNHAAYPVVSENWGASKGQDHHHDVCVVLNEKTLKAYQSDSLQAINVQTKNKLYVACSRARGGVYFVSEKQLKKLLLV